jgi:molybdenum-dependent DNA-binding transcriptional regulator ModE
MDLRAYYRKIREVENTLSEPYVVLVSVATQDGGKAGIRTEVTRHIAARLIAEGKARLATPEEAISFHEENEEAKKTFDQAILASRVQVVMMPARVNSKSSQN